MVLEEAHALGELVKQGWKPKRTIIYCLWDGEEPGLLGSTEWVEEHGAELNQHAVVYINSDSNSRGFLFASGSHTLEHMVNSVARDVQDPETKLNVQRRAQLRRIANSQKPDDREAARGADLRIGALGDGSDYAPFLDHAGVAAVNIGFGGESQGGIYHSIYDDFYWYTHFGDTQFVYERALSQLGGTMVMRMADADLLLFDPSASADTVKRYVGELKAELKEKQDKVSERNREIEEGVYAATADPEKKYVPPPKQENPPYLNFAPLENGVAAYERAAKRYKAAFSKLADSNPTVWDSPKFKDMNEQLILTERTFMTAEGLKERPWFKHQIYAPGAYTGYGVKTIPAVREMMDEDKWADADAGSVIVGGVLMKQAALVNSIAAQLESVVGPGPARASLWKHRKTEDGQVSGR